MDFQRQNRFRYRAQKLWNPLRVRLLLRLCKLSMLYCLVLNQSMTRNSNKKLQRELVSNLFEILTTVLWMQTQAQPLNFMNNFSYLIRKHFWINFDSFLSTFSECFGHLYTVLNIPWSNHLASLLHDREWIYLLNYI